MKYVAATINGLLDLAAIGLTMAFIALMAGIVTGVI